MENHGEIYQTVGTIYFDVSVPEGQKLDSKEVDLFFDRYYGSFIDRATYQKDGRQHYRVGAYKE